MGSRGLIGPFVGGLRLLIRLLSLERVWSTMYQLINFKTKRRGFYSPQKILEYFLYFFPLFFFIYFFIFLILISYFNIIFIRKYFFFIMLSYSPNSNFKFN